MTDWYLLIGVIIANVYIGLRLADFNDRLGDIERDAARREGGQE